MIIFDLDGVIRDLFSIFKKTVNEIKTWEEGTKLLKDLYRKPELIERSKPTEEFEVITKYFSELTIYSVQPKQWVNYTKLWCDKYLNKYNLIIFNSLEEKINNLDTSDYLIEDYPFKFIGNKKIILLDRNYNKEGHCLMRVFGKKGLQNLFETIFSLNQ